MNVTYYLDLLFVKGGGIGILIWALSAVSMAVAVRCFLAIRRERLFPDDARASVTSLFRSRQYGEALRSVSDRDDLFSVLVRGALVQSRGGRGAMEKGLLDAAEHRTSTIMRSVEWLNVIGNVAPMLGLLGTVWGMIGAFFKIVAAGSPDPRLLANDIGVALVTTLLGLVVAIPSLCVYAAMRNRVEEIANDAVLTVSELIAQTPYGERRSGPSRPAAPAGAK